MAVALPSTYHDPGIVQVGKPDTKGEPLARAYLSLSFLEKLRRTRTAAINNAADTTTAWTDNDLLYYWRNLVDEDSLRNGSVSGRVITRLDPAQKQGNLSGAGTSQFGSVKTWAALGAGNISSDGVGARQTTLGVAHNGVNAGVTSGLIIIAGFYIDITDTTTAFEITARSAADDTESYRLQYKYGGSLKTIARTSSTDTDDVTALTDGNNKQKSADVVMALRLDSASAGSAYFNGQRAAIAVASGPQAYAGTRAGVRMINSTFVSRGFLRYFEILKV